MSGESSSSQQLRVVNRRCSHTTRGTERGGSGAGSPSLLAVDRKCQCDVERVVVLDQRGVLVVENQLLQRPVQVVGLSKAEAGARLVDDAVFDLSVHTERRRGGLAQHRRGRQVNRQEVSLTPQSRRSSPVCCCPGPGRSRLSFRAAETQPECG